MRALLLVNALWNTSGASICPARLCVGCTEPERTQLLFCKGFFLAGLRLMLAVYLKIHIAYFQASINPTNNHVAKTSNANTNANFDARRYPLIIFLLYFSFIKLVIFSLPQISYRSLLLVFNLFLSSSIRPLFVCVCVCLCPCKTFLSIMRVN